MREPADPDHGTPGGGTLFIVSTPIGDPRDITERARQVLTDVDLIAAEDTRVARTLLGRLGLRRPLSSCYEHNEAKRVPSLVAKLEAGLDIALIADAGTPLISDPGFLLVRAAAERDLDVVPVPGACAALAALVVSGLPTDHFSVVGFLPRKAGARRARLEQLRRRSSTLVFYESPHRIVATLGDMVEILGDRQACLARSLTKAKETIVRARLSALRDQLGGEGRVYGEITLVVEGTGADAIVAEQAEQAERAVECLLAAGLPPRQVRDLVCTIVGAPKRLVYDLVLTRVDDSDSAARTSASQAHPTED